MTDTTTPLLDTVFTDLYALALPHNIIWIEHPYDIPGSLAIYEVSSVEEAIAEARGRVCGLMQSRILEGTLYLVLPVEIVTKSVIHPGDVIEVRDEIIYSEATQ
jgi:hypothetical protein